jgi:hypothetical protein
MEKRVATARAAMVKDFSLYIRKTSPLYGKYMGDPAVRGELFEIIGNQWRVGCVRQRQSHFLRRASLVC